MGLPSGTVTFLSTDVEDSTRLFRRLGNRYAPLLERHRSLLRAVWARHAGVEVKTEGDSFLVAFSSAMAAVESCREAQHRLLAEPWPPDGVFRVRMGIHTGPAVPRGGRYVALVVHEADRIASLGHGGQVLLSPSAAELVADRAGVELIDLGQWRVRDFDAPVQIRQLSIDALPSEFPVLRARPAEGHNLRPPRTGFVGREGDLAGIAAQLREAPLVSLVGPGGVGKTRTAIELGRRNLDAWDDGVWFVDLSTASNRADVLVALGEPFGVSGALDKIIEALRGRRALLIVDNCEQVIDDCAAVCAELLSAGRDLAVLATSREVLGLALERVWRLAPLVDPREAAELFALRARSADPLVQLDRAAVEDICAKLDGLPIAIELAAARLGTMTLGDVQAALADRLRLLRTRRSDLDRRHQTLGGLFDWSYGLLDDDEQLVFRRLSVFASSFDLEEAAAAVGDPLIDVADVVWALVERSLVLPDSGYGETRYRFLLTVRDYARSVARRHGDLEDAALQAARWYARSWTPERCRDVVELGRLDPVLGTIRHLAAVVADRDTGTAQHVAWIALQFYIHRGGGRDTLGELGALVASLTEGSRAKGPLTADLLATLATVYEFGGELELTQEMLEAVDHLAAHGLRPRWSAGAVEVARAALLMGRSDFARAAASAQAGAANVSDPYDRNRLLTIAGVASLRTGEPAAAQGFFEQSLAACRALGWTHYESVVLENMADLHCRLGNATEAVRTLVPALQIAVETRHLTTTAYCILDVAWVASQLGAWDEALQLFVAGQKRLAESFFQSLDADALVYATLLSEARSHVGQRARLLEVEAAGWTLEQTLAVAEDVLARAAPASVAKPGEAWAAARGTEGVTSGTRRETERR